MNDNLMNFQKELCMKKIQFQICNLNYQYDFYYVQNHFSLFQNEDTYKNISESNLIIIDRIINDQYFIVCFKNTIIIIQSQQISYLDDLFCSNKELTFYLDENVKTVFNQICKIHVKNICSFIDLSSNDEFLLTSIKSKLKTKSSSNIIWIKIKKNISRYLIHESYNRSLVNRFEKKSISNSIEIDKNDCVDIKMISAGASFFAYLVYYIKDQKLLTIKVLKNSNDEYLSKRENANYAKLKHPLIPEFFGTIKNYKNCTISNVIEYINGQTLDDIIFKRKTLKFNDKIYITFQIMLIIEFFHLKNYFIRDLKPNNIIITEDNIVVFIDFDRVIPYDYLSDFKEYSNDFPTDYVCSEFNTQYFSYESDICSLGNLIYIIFNEKIPQNHDIGKCFSQNICLAYLYNMCIKQDMKNRPCISKLINLFCLSFPHVMKNTNIKHLCDINIEISKKTIDVNNSYIQECNNSIDIRCNNYNNLFQHMIEYYSKNLKLTNDSDELVILGLNIILNNISNEENLIRGIDFIKQAADLNNKTAQIYLGVFYCYDSNHFQKGLQYLSNSVKQNHQLAKIIASLIKNRGYYIKKDIDDIIDYLSTEDQNDHYVQLYLGLWYLKRGKYIKEDINKGIYYLILSANNNNFKAQICLGIIYSKSKIDINFNSYLYDNMQFQFIEEYPKLNNLLKDEEKDDIESDKFFSKAAENQNIEGAQYIVGIIYLMLNNKNKTIHYLNLALNFASKIENPDNLYLLGYFFWKYKNDKKNAIKYFSMAAKKGEPFAEFVIGFYYLKYNKLLDLNGVLYIDTFLQEIILCDDDINIEKGIKYLTLSAQHKFEPAYVYLGYIYFDYPYIPHDYNRSYYYFSLGKYNPISQFFLAIYDIKNDINGIEKLNLLSNDNPIAQHCIGTLCLAKNNINEAMKFLKMSEPVLPNSQFLLGLIYYNKKEDMEAAINYLRKAAFQNEMHSQFIIGLCYINGQYVNKHYEVGIDFLTKSALNRCFNAYFALGFLYHEGKCTKNDYDKAIEFYIEGSNLDDEYSQNNLGIIYKHIRKDIDKSNYYFSKAYEKKKDILSMINLAKNYIYYNESNNDKNIDMAIKILIYASNKSRPKRNIRKKYTFIINELKFKLENYLNNYEKNNRKSLSISHKLLSFALVFKYGNDVDNIIQKFRKNYKYLSRYLVNEIYYTLLTEQLNDPAIFKNKYENYRDIDYVYDLNKNIISLKKLFSFKNEEKLSNSQQNITKDFYDGFNT